MTDKETFGEKDDMGVPGENIPGHLQDELHHGAAEITDMGDYGLSEEQKIALGIERMPEMPSAPADEPEAGEIVGE